MADSEHHRRSSRWPWVLFLAAIVLTSIATHVPLRGFVSALSERYDKQLHFVAYGVMTLLGGWATYRWRWGPWCSGLLVSTLVGVDEVFQAWVPSRTVDRMDALAGWLGVLAGTVVVLLGRGWWSGRQVDLEVPGRISGGSTDSD